MNKPPAKTSLAGTVVILLIAAAAKFLGIPLPDFGREETSAPATRTEERASETRPAEAAPRPASRPAATAPAKAAVKTDFASFRDGDWVTGAGRVKKVLPDDVYPPRHQRFILLDDFSHTLLVAHNIDEAARLPDLEEGDRVAFRGEFKDNDEGGVVHWTHPDSSGRRAGGWLRKE